LRIACLDAFHRLSRADNWWYYKIPPLLSVAYLVMLACSMSPVKGIVTTLAALISLSAVASYGHVLNDIFDIAQDRLAGKPNRMAARSPFQRLFWCGLFLALGFITWAVTDMGSPAGLALAADYLLPTLYSVPPVRLKERGVWAALADAAGVHAIPTLFVGLVFLHQAGCPQAAGFLSAAVGWAFLVGLRGILIHQLQDRLNDQKAGASTMAVSADPARLRLLAACVVFPVELLAFLVLCLAVFPFAPLPLYMVLGYGAFDYVRLRIAWKAPFDPIPLIPGYYIPPFDLYEVWLPLGLALTLAVHRPVYLLLVVAHVALFYTSIRIRALEVFRVLRCLTRCALLVFSSLFPGKS